MISTNAKKGGSKRGKGLESLLEKREERMILHFASTEGKGRKGGN